MSEVRTLGGAGSGGGADARAGHSAGAAMKQSQKRQFRNAGCDCRECAATPYWVWLAPILALVLGGVIVLAWR